MRTMIHDRPGSWGRLGVLTLALLLSVGCGAPEDEHGRQPEPTAPGRIENRARVATRVRIVDAYRPPSEGGTDQWSPGWPGFEQYAYAPSIIWDNGTYHAFFCSAGNAALNQPDGSGEWDYVRYTFSTDGVTWSEPSIAVGVSNRYSERAACDPAVVYYGGYYYMFYTGNRINVQSALFVARATSYAGPWYKLDESGQWLTNAPNPKMIIGPKSPKPEGPPAYYGAGQATVLNLHNTLWLWYFDDTDPSGPRTYLTRSTDPANWPAGTPILEASANNAPLVLPSLDVKFDPGTNRFVMHAGSHNSAGSSFFIRRYSYDGISWSQQFIPSSTNYGLANWGHNFGYSGDRNGHINLTGNGIISYGATYDPAATTDTPAAWDMYGHDVSDAQVVKGDFDGDGRLDMAMVDTKRAKWYIRSSTTGNIIDGIWGWQWVGMGPHHVLACADYDGDGRTDKAIVDYYTAGGPTWYILKSNWGNTVYVAEQLQSFSWNAGMNVNDLKVMIGDYDGDRKADKVLIAAGPNGFQAWHYVLSGGGLIPGTAYSGQEWWGANVGYYEPISGGDFDGDGRTDRAMVRDSIAGKQWWIINSSGNANQLVPSGSYLGNSYQRHLIADMNGDGKSDIVLLHDYGTPGIGWFVYASTPTGTGTTGVPNMPWGMVWGSSIHHLFVGDYRTNPVQQRAEAVAIDHLGNWLVLDLDQYNHGTPGIPANYNPNIPYQ